MEAKISKNTRIAMFLTFFMACPCSNIYDCAKKLSETGPPAYGSTFITKVASNISLGRGSAAS